MPMNAIMCLPIAVARQFTREYAMQNNRAGNAATTVRTWTATINTLNTPKSIVHYLGEVITLAHLSICAH